MPILCLEGPSAVGKSTAAAALPRTVAIAEANLLFERPADEPPDWYFRRQADRWAMAAACSARGVRAVLDGDPFQPLWYNWVYGSGLDALEAFYRPRVASGEMGFPDRYVVLGAPPGELRRRRDEDPARRRRHFDQHLRFIEPQRRYFRAMQALAPERVRFVDATDPDATVRAVADAAHDATPEAHPLRLLDAMLGWLRATPPE
jgi:hypothetical protein